MSIGKTAAFVGFAGVIWLGGAILLGVAVGAGLRYLTEHNVTIQFDLGEEDCDCDDCEQEFALNSFDAMSSGPMTHEFRVWDNEMKEGY